MATLEVERLQVGGVDGQPVDSCKAGRSITENGITWAGYLHQSWGKKILRECYTRKHTVCLCFTIQSRNLGSKM